MRRFLHPIASRFDYLLGFFLLVFAVAAAVWYGALYMVTVPGPDRLIQIFAEGYGIVDGNVSAQLADDMEDEGVAAVKTRVFSPYETRIYEYFQAFGQSAEFAILAASNFTGEAVGFNEQLEQYFIPIDGGFAAAIGGLGDFAAYAYGGVDWGLKVFDKADGAYNSKLGFSAWIDFAGTNAPEDYYLMFGRRSVNFGEYGSAARTTNGFAAFSRLCALLRGTD